jgi:hypothetical protein
MKAVPGITVKAKSKWLNAIHVSGTQCNKFLLIILLTK